MTTDEVDSGKEVKSDLEGDKMTLLVASARMFALLET